jgi:hypothetical protein
MEGIEEQMTATQQMINFDAEGGPALQESAASHSAQLLSKQPQKQPRLHALFSLGHADLM